METDGLRALVWGSSLIIAIGASITTYFLLGLLSNDNPGKVRLLALVLLGAVLSFSGPAVDWLIGSFTAPSILVLSGPVAKWAPAALALALGAWLLARKRLSS